MNLKTAMQIAFGLPMIDALEELLRKIRPYELEPGSADAAFDKSIDAVIGGLRPRRYRGHEEGLQKSYSFDAFREIRPKQARAPLC